MKDLTKSGQPKKESEKEKMWNPPSFRLKRKESTFLGVG